MPVNPYRTVPVWQQAVSQSFTFVLKTAGAGTPHLNFPLKSAPLTWGSSTWEQGWGFKESKAFSLHLGSWSTSWKLIMLWNLPVRRSMILLLWQMCKLRHQKAHRGRGELTRNLLFGPPAHRKCLSLSLTIPWKWTKPGFQSWGLAGRDERTASESSGLLFQAFPLSPKYFFEWTESKV